MGLKIVPPEELKEVDETIEVLENLIKTDTKELDRKYHMQALKDLKEYKKSLNIKK